MYWITHFACSRFHSFPYLHRSFAQQQRDVWKGRKPDGKAMKRGRCSWNTWNDFKLTTWVESIPWNLLYGEIIPLQRSGSTRCKVMTEGNFKSLRFTSVPFFKCKIFTVKLMRIIGWEGLFWKASVTFPLPVLWSTRNMKLILWGEEGMVSSPPKVTICLFLFVSSFKREKVTAPLSKPATMSRRHFVSQLVAYVLASSIDRLDNRAAGQGKAPSCTVFLPQVTFNNHEVAAQALWVFAHL